MIIINKIKKKARLMTICYFSCMNFIIVITSKVWVSEGERANVKESLGCDNLFFFVTWASDLREFYIYIIRVNLLTKFVSLTWTDFWSKNFPF